MFCVEGGVEKPPVCIPPSAVARCSFPEEGGQGSELLGLSRGAVQASNLAAPIPGFKQWIQNKQKPHRCEDTGTGSILLRVVPTCRSRSRRPNRGTKENREASRPWVVCADSSAWETFPRRKVYL